MVSKNQKILAVIVIVAISLLIIWRFQLLPLPFYLTGDKYVVDIYPRSYFAPHSIKGVRFNITLTIENYKDLAYWQTLVYFNSSLVQYVRAYTPEHHVFENYADYSSGIISTVTEYQYKCVSVGNNLYASVQNGVSSTGKSNLAILEFEVVSSPGESNYDAIFRYYIVLFNNVMVDGIILKTRVAGITQPVDANYYTDAVMFQGGTPLTLLVSSEPANTIDIAVGSTITFTAVASGGVYPYLYYWYKNGSLVYGLIENVYALTPTELTEGKSYTIYCEVVDKIGQVAQSEATMVKVIPEFPSIIFLTIFLALATLMIVSAKKKLV